MLSLRLAAPNTPLRSHHGAMPEPGPGQVLLRVRACGVCRTDLHVVDGDLPEAKPDLVPGHEIVGEVAACGAGVERFVPGARIGVPWLGWTCGQCGYCRAGRENLCDSARFTGYQLDGGYAEYAVADARYCFPLPERYDDLHAAPLLCAGLIGYRALRIAGDARRIGLYGFGAAAHLIAQLAVQQGREVYAFTRPGDVAAQAFARTLGCSYAGDSTAPPPQALDAALLFAPVGALIPQALQHVAKGGTVVCAGIHMSEIPSFPYAWLWGERRIVSVANLTRRDGEEFFAEAKRHPLQVHAVPYPLPAANQALHDLRGGRIQGAAVLLP